MTPMRFRPKLWPTLFTLPALVVLLGLGTWQLDRMQWKADLIAERVARTSAAPVPLPRSPAPAEIAAFEYRRSVATGTFLHDREMYLAARSLRGNPGWQVVTPLRLAEGGAGAVSHVLVNRGWVPLDRKDPATRSDGLLRGQVTVEGVLRVSREPGWLVPDNAPDKNSWFWVDLPAMAAHAGLPPDAVAPLYLEAGPAETPGLYPLGGQTRIHLPNDHLQYAITWYALAVALAVIYVAYHRRGGA